MKNQNLIKVFKRRWQRVNKIESHQLRQLTIKDKLEQFFSLIETACFVRLAFRERQESRKVRARWILLKKGLP